MSIKYEKKPKKVVQDVICVMRCGEIYGRACGVGAISGGKYSSGPGKSKRASRPRPGRATPAESARKAGSGWIVGR